jgi:hypothetical protein
MLLVDSWGKVAIELPPSGILIHLFPLDRWDESDVSCSGRAGSSSILFHVNVLVIAGSIYVSVALLLLVCILLRFC